MIKSRHGLSRNKISNFSEVVTGPQKGPEKWCHTKLVAKFWKNFDTFWRFLIFLTCTRIVEKCRNLSWHFLAIFDVFWRGPFPLAPCCGPMELIPGNLFLGGGPPAKPPHEIFPEFVTSFAVQNRGSFGKRLCWSSCLLWQQTSPKASPKLRPKLHQNFAPDCPPFKTQATPKTSFCRNLTNRWPGESQRESGRFARIDSQKKKTYLHNVRAIRANRLKPAKESSRVCIFRSGRNWPGPI